MLLQKNLAKSLLAFSVVVLVGCGSKGPLVPYCISDPNNQKFRCSSTRKEKLYKKIEEVEGYTCMPPSDATSFLDACNKKVVPPKRTQCVIGNAQENFLFHCYDQRRKESRNLSFADTENFVCQDVNDFLFVVDYCEQKRLKK